MNIVSRQAVIAAYRRCLNLDPNQDHQMACNAAALALGLTPEIVEDTVNAVNAACDVLDIPHESR